MDEFHPKMNRTLTRWAPTSYKWSYNPYKWPYNWVTGVITLLIEVITPLVTSRGPTLYQLAPYVSWYTATRYSGLGVLSVGPFVGDFLDKYSRHIRCLWVSQHVRLLFQLMRLLILYGCFQKKGYPKIDGL